MKLSMLRANRSALWLIAGMVATTLPVSAQNLLTATPATVTLTCSTTTGPSTAVNVVVKPVTTLVGSATLVVTFGSVGAGITVTAPSVTTLSTANQTTGLTYTVRAKAGCAGTVAGSNTQTFQFSTGSGADRTVTATITTTVGSSSPLTTTPASIALTCRRDPSGPTYTPGPAQVLAVRSASTGGTPFTVENSTYALPAWLTATPLSGGTATSTAVNISFSAAAGCGSFAAGTTNTFVVHLANAPSADKLVTVSLQVLPPSSLVATPSPATLSYVKGSGTTGRVDVAVTSATVPAPFFTVDGTSLPPWLTVDAMSGTVPRSIRFSSTVAADSMAPGNYQTTIRLKVSGQADLAVPISLQLNNPAPKLTVSEGITRNITWTIGSAVPSLFVTAVSSDSPIPYSITTGGTLAPIVSAANQKGLAYSFGTPIPVTFDPAVFASAQPGTTMVGTVALTSGTPSTTITVTFSVSVQAPGATISSISPASVPTAPAGQSFTLTLLGSGFVTGSDLSLRTRVGVVATSGFVIEPSISVNVLNTSIISLTITVPTTASVNLPFSPTGTGGTVILGVCNPNGTTCSTPTGTVSFTIGSNPIISAVTSASSFLQVTAPTVQSVAPYEMLSIFGSNFCSSGGTGCASTDILYGVPDPSTLAYPTFVSPEAVSATQRKLTVQFWTQATPPVLVGTAPILFATNGQINVMAPSTLTASTTLDIVVNFGYGSGATMRSSDKYPVNIVANNPGIFTVAANGQGDGAILSSTYAPIIPGSEAGVRSTSGGTDSDTVQIYMTGLGVPNSSGNNANAGSGFTWSTDCVTEASYRTSLNNTASSSLTTLDGVIINSALLNTNRLAPCFRSTSDSSGTPPTVTIGGVAGTVTYAGWVADSVAGLYQLNVQLPSSTGSYTTTAGASLAAITTPVQLPVIVTAPGSRTSQAGVNMWVARRLKVLPPSGGGLTGQVNTAWASSNNLVVASLGTSPYRYSLSSGVLPTGLLLNTTTGAISGTPAAGTAGSYAVTVTATDSANFPLTGKVSFTLTVAGGLVVSASGGPSPYVEEYGTANATVTTISAAGGTYPYTYAITSATPPLGLTINTNTGVIGVSSLTPAGNYNITITATDATTTSPVTGTLTLQVKVGLKVVVSTPASPTATNAATITTATTTGQSGTITYSLDSTTSALSWVTFNTSTGVLAVTGSSVAGTYPVTITATDSTPATGGTGNATGTRTFNMVIQ